MLQVYLSIYIYVYIYTNAPADGICDLKKLIQLGFIPSVGL